MSMGQWWNDADSGKAEVVGENTGQCHCVSRGVACRQLTAWGVAAPDDMCELCLILYQNYVSMNVQQDATTRTQFILSINCVHLQLVGHSLTKLRCTVP